MKHSEKHMTTVKTNGKATEGKKPRGRSKTEKGGLRRRRPKGDRRGRNREEGALGGKENN